MVGERKIFINNLISGDKNYNKPFLFVWQPADLCNRVNDSQLKQLDYNVYTRANTKTTRPLILWSPAENSDCQLTFESFKSLQELYPQFMINSRLFDKYNGPIYKSSKLGKYELLKVFPGSTTAGPLPTEISNLLGKKDKDDSYIGAYPLVP